MPNKMQTVLLKMRKNGQTQLTAVILVWIRNHTALVAAFNLLKTKKEWSEYISPMWHTGKTERILVLDVQTNTNCTFSLEYMLYEPINLCCKSQIEFRFLKPKAPWQI